MRHSGGERTNTSTPDSKESGESGPLPPRLEEPTAMVCASLFLSVFLGLAPSLAEGKGPQVGQVAPELGLRGWIRREGAPGVTLAELRGRVVILHSFAWNCSSCLKVGLPLAVDLLEANEADGLTMLSVTTPAYQEETLGILDKFGVRHPVATENPFQNENPYVDASVNPITYMYVIGRNGDLIWRGDPSTDLEGCLDAVAHALHQESGRALDRDLHPDLAEAVAPFFAGDYAKARGEAESILKKSTRSKKEDALRVAADARWLVERIDTLGERLVAELEASLQEKSALRYMQLHRDLEGFRGTPIGERVEALDMASFAKDEIEEAEAWLEIVDARPALFPVRVDKATKKFDKLLAKYVSKNPAGKYTVQAEEWRGRFAARQG